MKIKVKIKNIVYEISDITDNGIRYTYVEILKILSAITEEHNKLIK